MAASSGPKGALTLLQMSGASETKVVSIELEIMQILASGRVKIRSIYAVRNFPIVHSSARQFATRCASPVVSGYQGSVVTAYIRPRRAREGR